MENGERLDKITFYFNIGKSLESIPEKNEDFSEKEIKQARFSDHIIMDNGKQYCLRRTSSIKDDKLGLVLKVEYFGCYPACKY